MKNAQPLFDSATHYQIELRGRIDVEWLQSFDGSAEIIVNEVKQMDDLTVLHVHTDQSGIVGLVRRLHGLGMTILGFQVVQHRGKAGEGEEQRQAPAPGKQQTAPRKTPAD
ncbi:MAG: hypothetical protein ACM3QS_10250 [Bacteroidota bacterium]